MKKHLSGIRRWIAGAICAVLAVALLSVPAPAQTVTNGWDETGSAYYVNGSMVKNKLRTIDGDIYYFDQDGQMLTSQFYRTADGSKKYTFYFGKDGKAYRAEQDKYYVTFKNYKIKKIKYGFDEKGHMCTGVWASNSGKVFVFKSNGKLNEKKTKKLRKLTKRNKKSKTALKNVKKAFGKQKKKVDKSDSCNPFGSNLDDPFTDYIVTFANVEVQMTRNDRTKVFNINGVYPRAED